MAIHKCLACGKEVEDTCTGYHRYGCIGPSTWSGCLEGFSHPERCWCGEKAVIRISRGLSNFYACCESHARKRKINKTRQISAFAPFVLACYKR